MSNSIALIGDYNEHVIAHTAIPKVLELARTALVKDLQWQWIETLTIDADLNKLKGFSGFWVVLGSPYVNMDGVLNVIR